MQKIMFNDRFGLTQAVLNGTKTQTRRIINITQSEYQIDCLAANAPHNRLSHVVFSNKHGLTKWIRLPFLQNEVVAVAQNYSDARRECDAMNRAYDSLIISRCMTNVDFVQGKTNKMFVRAGLMPHQIQITNVKIEKLQDISDEDCLKEGVMKIIDGHYCIKYKTSKGIVTAPFYSPRMAFASLIDKISGKGTWERNPYVFAYTFKLLRGGYC